MKFSLYYHSAGVSDLACIFFLKCINSGLKIHKCMLEFRHLFSRSWFFNNLYEILWIICVHDTISCIWYQTFETLVQYLWEMVCFWKTERARENRMPRDRIVGPTKWSPLFNIITHMHIININYIHILS